MHENHFLLECRFGAGGLGRGPRFSCNMLLDDLMTIIRGYTLKSEGDLGPVGAESSNDVLFSFNTQDSYKVFNSVPDV